MSGSSRSHQGRCATLRVCLRQPLTRPRRPWGWPLSGPAGKLGGQGPSGLFSVGLVVAEAVVKLADQLVPDPAERFLVAVAEAAAVLVKRPGAR